MQENILKNRKLILGSKSPRRKQILEEAGFMFEVRVQDMDEDFDPSMPVLFVAEDLAKRKAQILLSTLSAHEILITADSVVILDNMIYNKPDNYEEGMAMLSALSGRTHTVATGVCLMSIHKSVSFTVTTDITFDHLSLQETDYYLSHYKPYDKAGSYGIQDWIGLCKISKIDGSYTNVMGLPMRSVYESLVHF